MQFPVRKYEAVSYSSHTNPACTAVMMSTEEGNYLTTMLVDVLHNHNGKYSNVYEILFFISG